MLQKIKKPLFTLLSVFLGLFFPAYFVYAAWPDWLAKNIGVRLLFFIVRIFVNFAVWIVGLAGSLLNWVLSPGFISYSYTKPGNTPPGNPVIEAGLGVTQGFVNMLLVLVLVYIAIATILRLAGYETKKLLVTFIIVALLVNFAPVFCGLIVDAANIIMNFFVQDIRADAFGETMGRLVSKMVSGFNEEETDWKEGLSYTVKLGVMIPFLIGVTFVLLIFTLIFILRYLVIWLLVILSPLAFVAYILPATRKYFEQWWKQFLAWTFIGVTCGFFLYLGLLLAVKIQAGGAVTTPTTKGGDPLFNAILPYFVSLIFLGIGIVFGLSTSAMGASTVINFAKSKGKAGAKTGWQTTKWGARKTAQGIQLARENFAKTDKGKSLAAWGRTQLSKQKYGEGKAGFWGATARTASILNPLRYVRRGVGRLAGGKIPEDARTDIKVAEDSVKDVEETPVLLKKFQDAVTDTKRIGILNKIIEKGKIKDITDVEKFGESAINKKEINRLMKHAKNWEADKKLNAAFPDIAAEYVTDPEFAKALKKDPLLRNKTDLIVSKIKSEDYKNIAQESLDNIEVVDAILLKAMGGHISKLIEEHGAVAARKIEDRIDKGAPVGKRAKKYLISQAGRAMIAPKKEPRFWELEETAEKVIKETEALRRFGERKKEGPPPSEGYIGGGGPTQ